MDFVRRTKKSHIILAPTGIAAINAGGVTIHAMFGLPLRAFFPTHDRVDERLGNNIADLFKHFRFRKNKLKLLREVELIIIDEVSMLRADVLDMMDFALRHIRRNGKPFGGVQMLFIGDLHQLPPVVRDENILREYYKTPFFFSAKALENLELITIELTKVYRQKDEDFLKILNEIREGHLSDEGYQQLNERYLPDFEPQKETYVYLTSHNKMADSINQKKLQELKGKSYTYKAKITGEFKENQYPNDEELELKVGTQIMFIRNDASGERHYYNGKLAEVMALSPTEITVLIEGDDKTYTLKKETWENKRYTLGEDKSVEEEVLGSFEQYPIRLAWAVTIHKSQGLTFDRVIIDAGQSFASGQVYVALSRCRTLQGIILKSEITKNAVFNDRRVNRFQDDTHANERITEIINTEKHAYALDKVLSRIEPLWFERDWGNWYNQALVSRDLNRRKAEKLYQALLPKLKNWNTIYEKLQKIIAAKVHKMGQGQDTWQSIEEKTRGAVNFYYNEVHNEFFTPIKHFYAETKGAKGLKAFNEITHTLLEDLEDYLNQLKTAHLMETALFDAQNDTKVEINAPKVPTHILTFQLFEQGKTIAEIAEERNLVPSTIYGHLAKFAERGLLDLSRIISKEKDQRFREQYQKAPQENLNDWKKHLPEDFEYHEIRLLWNHYRYLDEKQAEDHPED